MAFVRRDDVREKLRTRADQLNATTTVGDVSVMWQLVEEFRHEFPGSRTDSAIYQLIGYYLRPKPVDGKRRDARKTYANGQLAQLALLSPAERRLFALRTRRTERAVESAVARYRKAKTKQSTIPINRQFAAERIKREGYFDFSSPVDLKIVGTTKNAIAAAKRVLADPYGLSLRAPNILFHTVTKRVYRITTTIEQLALLNNLATYLRARAAYIKEHWEVVDADPVDDTTDDDKYNREHHTAAFYEGRPVLENGAVDMTSPRVKLDRSVKHIEELIERLNKIPFARKGHTLHERLKELSTVVQRILNAPQPKAFDSSDPETYTDLVGDAHKRKPSPDGHSSEDDNNDISPDGHSSEDDNISPDGHSSEDDNSWMNTWVSQNPRDI